MANLRILVVEDERIVARDIQNMLHRLGYADAFIASKGKEAIKIAEETPPDLILMDIKLKDDMDGIETAERIREHLCVPIIYISALSDAESLKKAKKTEPFFFISKPIEESELKAAIKKACSPQSGQNKYHKPKQNIGKIFQS